MIEAREVPGTPPAATFEIELTGAERDAFETLTGLLGFPIEIVLHMAATIGPVSGGRVAAIEGQPGGYRIEIPALALAGYHAAGRATGTPWATLLEERLRMFLPPRLGGRLPPEIVKAAGA